MNDRRWRYIASRWLHVCGYALVGAFAFEVVLALAWGPSDFLTPFSPPFVAATTWLLAFLLIHVVVEPIRVRRRQWVRTVLYPPAWVAVGLAIVLAAWLEAPLLHARLGRPPYWVDPYILAAVGSALVASLFLHNSRDTRQPVRAERKATAESLDWPTIESWLASGEEPLLANQRDLFGLDSLAQRAAQLLVEDHRSIALLGPWGSGKTSLLNLLQDALNRRSDRITVVARLDVWAVPDAKDVPRIALSAIVQSLDELCDVLAFRGIPLSYQRLAAAEPTGNLSRFLGVGDGQSDSLDEIERLSPLLTAVDAHVVLVVEDLDRAGANFDTRHLERLLWALRRVPRVKFVVAMDHSRSRFDFSKVCDATILMPELEHDHVLEIVSVAYEHWRSAYRDIDPRRNEAGDKFKLADARLGGLVEYLRRTGRDTPLNALVEVLATPRTLKHVLSQVDRSWRQLHGEVDLDDLVVVAAVRQASEPVYRFLLANIDVARHDVDPLRPQTQQVKAAWEQLLATLPSASTVQRLVDLLQIEQLQSDRIQMRAEPDLPQGVYLDEPVDYFRRIVAERLADSELRDQTVLRHIEQWQAGTSNELVSMLTRPVDPDGYVDRWEHFAARHTDEELKRLLEDVERTLLARDGRDANYDDTAVIALWRRCNRRLERGRHDDWLAERIEQAARTSLLFLERFLYYWTGDRGIVSDEGALVIKQRALDSIRTNAPDAERLRRLITEQEPFLLARLNIQLREVQGWQDYFAPVLVDAARRFPEVFLPQLANLLGSSESSIVPASAPRNQPRFINAYQIDRAKAQRMFPEHLKAALLLLAEYEGEDGFVTRARGSARAWLTELDSIR